MIGSIGFLARSQLRRRWRTVAFLTLFVGVFGGMSISLVAGSRRSSSVVDRYFAAGTHYDLEVFAPSLTSADLLAIPGVVRADLTAYVATSMLAPDGTVVGGINANAVDPGAIDRTIRVLDGNLPDDSDPFAVLVNEAFVDQFDVAVGDRVDVQMFGRDQEDEVGAGIYEPRGPHYTFRVAAVVRGPLDIAVDRIEAPGASAYADANQMMLPARFYEEHRDEFLDFGAAFDVQLADGLPGQAAFRAALDDLRIGDASVLVGPAQVSFRRNTLDTPVDLETTALLSLGLGLAVAGAVTIGLLLRTEQRAHDGGVSTLRALGCTEPQLASAAALRAIPVAFGGATLAVGIAVVLSSRYPVGVGRQLELDRGFDVNIATLAIGAVAILVFVIGLGFVLGQPARARDDVRSPRGTFAGWLARIGAPAEVWVGAHFAFERRRGSRSVPSRQAIAGGAAALAIVTALAMFVGGVDRLYGVSAEHGWPWDAAIGNVNFSLADATLTELAVDPRLAAQSRVRYGGATVGGAAVEVLAVDEAGTAPPQSVSGRLPTSASEIAIGARLLRRLDVEVGDTVTFSVVGGEFDIGAVTTELDLTIVGVAMVPILGSADFGDAAIVTLDAVAAAGGNIDPSFVLAGLRGDDPEDVAVALDRDLTQEIVTDATPARIVSLHRVRPIPLLGISLAGALGTIILAYTLAAGVRARTRDLAVLQALGLPARRLRRVLSSQGIALTLAMILGGLPIGVLAGSLLWRNVADQLGVRDQPVLTPLIALLVPASLLISVAASLYPARRARRQHVASRLRVE